MYSMVDTFGLQNKWTALSCSVVYAASANWAMYLRFKGEETSLPKQLAFWGQSIPIIYACLMFLYLWVFMFLRARSAYKRREATLFSVKEWTFLVYSVATFCSAATVFISSASYG